jgi:hypothetical protein
MAASNFLVYGEAILNIHKGLLDLDTGTIVAVLLGSGYTPDDNAHGLWSDLSGAELSTAGGYTAGGVALSGVTVTRSTGTIKFDADDVVWNPATLTAKYVALVKRAGGSLVSGDYAIGYSQLETGGAGTLSPSGAPLTVAWNAGGIFTVARA